MDIKLKPINIKFKNLVYTVADGKKVHKNVLKNIAGEFRSGELTAIMGPSGAGKSSLLNILTGYTQSGFKGEISMNSDILISNKKYQKLCSYILQDDNLYSNFTVEESMMLAADLKIAGVSVEEKELMIDNILNTLHLNYAKRTKCGYLSGGQRKRLSIALELLDNPTVLFLDEPTTGLDSTSSAYCVRLLHNLAREGRTIICTIHQPEATVYELFDHIYVLADGNCIYKGSPANTVPYLSANGLQCPQYHNSADFLLEVATCEYGNFTNQLAESAKDIRWRLQGMYKTNSTNSIQEFQIEPTKQTIQRMNSNDSRETFSVPSEWSKLWILYGRCYIQYYRDWTVTHLKLALHIVTAILVGVMYGDSGISATKSIANIGLFMFGLCYLWYTTMMPGILKFPSEIAIIKKETFNNWYKLRTYYLATLLTTTPIHIIFSTIYATIVFFVTEQHFEFERYFKYILIYILTTIVADGVGLTVGSILDPVNGTFTGATLSAFKLAFCGFLALPSQIPTIMKYLMYTSTMKYSLEGITLSLYDYNRPDMICPSTEMYCHYKNSKMILNELGMTHGNYEFNVGMIIGQLVMFKTLSYFLLKRRLKGK